MEDVAEQVFLHTPVPSVILDPDCNIQKASNSWLQYLELTSDNSWLGTGYLSLLRNAHFSEADVAHLQEMISLAIETCEVQIWKHDATVPEAVRHIRVIPIKKDGSILHLLVEGQVRKITAEERLVAKEDKGLSTDEAFRIMVGAVKDYAIFLLDTKGYVVTWNAGAELNKGYTPQEIIGKHFSIFYGEDDLKADKPAKELEICLQEGRVEDEGWRYRKDGTRFWANVVITAVYDNGLHVGFAKVTRDLTERKAAEAQLIAAYEESAKLKSDFLANMSHEIRTPMHGMLSACTLLLDTDLTMEQRELSNIIEDSGGVLLQVINDILDYSKLASGNFSIASDIVGITNILNSVIRSQQTTLAPGVHIETNFSSNLPRAMQGDPLRYRQIIQNLIGNSAKFTDKGFIRIDAQVEEEDDETFTILTEVTDTGIGIPEEARTSLFTPFSQFDNSRTKLYQGTGLGLSISRSLAQLMSGEIGFKPNPVQHGAVFWFTAVFKKVKAFDVVTSLSAHLIGLRTDSIEGRPKPLNTPSEFFVTKTLLLAEDNLINQKVMLRLLSALGFQNVDTAGDGAQAVSLVTSDLGKYDAILMDINMPVIDGLSATKQLREAGFNAPIIALTANALTGDKEEFLAQGMNDYISKPVDRVVLVDILKKWLLQSTMSWIGP
jgi:osomolarity two-component system sensor histidine kinase TcsA